MKLILLNLGRGGGGGGEGGRGRIGMKGLIPPTHIVEIKGNKITMNYSYIMIIPHFLEGSMHTHHLCTQHHEHYI